MGGSGSSKSGSDVFSGRLPSSRSVYHSHLLHLRNYAERAHWFVADDDVFFLFLQVFLNFFP